MVLQKLEYRERFSLRKFFWGVSTACKVRAAVLELCEIVRVRRVQTKPTTDGCYADFHH